MAEHNKSMFANTGFLEASILSCEEGGGIYIYIYLFQTVYINTTARTQAQAKSHHWHVWTESAEVRHSHSFSSTSGGDDVRLQRRSWARLCECRWWLFPQLPFCLDLLQHPTVGKKRLKLSLGLHPSSWIVTVLRLAHSFSVLDPSACRSFRRQWRKAREHQDQTIYVTCNLTMDFLQAIESKVNCGGWNWQRLQRFSTLHQTRTGHI